VDFCLGGGAAAGQTADDTLFHTFCSLSLFWFSTQELRAQYYSIVACLFAACIVLQSHSRFSDASWSSRRALVYAAVVGFGLVPCAHWGLRLGDSPQAAAEYVLFVPRVAGAYLLAGTGVAFYLSHFPECCCTPGRVDIVGASHQWWHVFVVAGLAWWYQSGLHLLEFRMNYPCE
jgi:predicted membrane channel-forming protein YqfA (hemolysin III family)